MKPRYILTTTGLLLGSVLLAGCTAAAIEAPVASTTQETAVTTVAVDATLTAADAMAANDDYTTTNDDEWSTDGVTTIDLDSQSGTVTIDAAGTYILTGTLKGQVVVAAPDDALVALVLDDASISSASGPAIDVESADDVVVSLTGSNSLSDASSYADGVANAALYSSADLTITGDGSLEVRGNGNDGITSTDDLVVLSGTITVTAADDGLRGKDALAIEGGTITVTAGGDALKADNADDAMRGYIYVSNGDITATAGDDGLAATTDVVETGGTIIVTSTGKGLVGDALVVLEGADLTVNATDDALHSNGQVGINLGTATLSSDDDGIHADGAIFIDGGTTTVARSVEGVESVAITINAGELAVTASDDGINATAGGVAGGSEQDDGSILTVNGGTVTVTAGSDGIDSNGSAALLGGTVAVLSAGGGGTSALDVNGALTGTAWVAATVTGSAGDVVTVTDGSGAVVFTQTATGSFGSVAFLIPAITAGGTYTVTTSSGSSASVTAGVNSAEMMGGPGGGQRGAAQVAVEKTGGPGVAGPGGVHHALGLDRGDAVEVPALGDPGAVLAQLDRRDAAEAGELAREVLVLVAALEERGGLVLVGEHDVEIVLQERQEIVAIAPDAKRVGKGERDLGPDVLGDGDGLL